MCGLPQPNFLIFFLLKRQSWTTYLQLGPICGILTCSYTRHKKRIEEQKYILYNFFNKFIQFLFAKYKEDITLSNPFSGNLNATVKTNNNNVHIEAHPVRTFSFSSVRKLRNGKPVKSYKEIVNPTNWDTFDWDASSSLTFYVIKRCAFWSRSAIQCPKTSM